MRHADGPRILSERAVIDAREREIDLEHVAPLNNWVRLLKVRLGSEAIVPWFDPWDGGINARILWLLEAPGPKATRERGGSGFISCNNDDQTAANTFNTRAEADVDRTDVVHWNAIPYYLGTDTKIRAHTPGDIAEAGPLLVELLELLPSIEVVILGGGAARDTWAAHAPRISPVRTIECPHPSPTNLNTRPASRARIVDAWRRTST